MNVDVEDMFVNEEEEEEVDVVAVVVVVGLEFPLTEGIENDNSDENASGIFEFPDGLIDVFIGKGRSDLDIGVPVLLPAFERPPPPPFPTPLPLPLPLPFPSYRFTFCALDEEADTRISNAEFVD